MAVPKAYKKALLLEQMKLHPLESNMKCLPIKEGERFTQGWFISAAQTVLGIKDSALKIAESVAFIPD